MSHAADPIKVYDARWEVAEFDDTQVRRLFESTYLYAKQLHVDTIVLTRDARLGGPRVMEIACDEARRAGLRVYLVPNPVSTPQGYFAAMTVSRAHPNTMGLGITASHNPAQYIGVKFTIPLVRAIGQDCGPTGGLTEVRRLYHSSEKLPTSPDRGSLHVIDVSREYVDFSMDQANVAPGDLAGLSVVLDAFHGSAGPEVTMALEKAGAKVHPLRLIPNGEFPTGSPNPTSQGKMANAIKLAAELNTHAVIGIDGDGDRIVFGDRRGILTAGFAFVPILRACLAGTKGPQSALYDPKVSPLALAEWGKLGARPVLFRNGHSQIKDYMTQTNALAAAEESGHYYHQFKQDGQTISAENQILTILLFLAGIKKQPTLLDDLWAKESQIATTGEFNYQFPNDDTLDRALAAVVETFQKEGSSVVTATPDGIELQGTCLARGVHLDPAHVKLAPGWYSGYLRVATNEKGVVRSYFSAGEKTAKDRVEHATRDILEKKFGGKVID
jgi:phosphomannomutase